MENWKPRTAITSEGSERLVAILADASLLRSPERNEFREVLQKALQRKAPWDPTIREIIAQIGGNKTYRSVTQDYILPYRISDFQIRRLTHRKVLTWLREISVVKKPVEASKSKSKTLLSKSEISKARAALLATIKYAADREVPTRGSWIDLPEAPEATDPHPA